VERILRIYRTCTGQKTWSNHNFNKWFIRPNGFVFVGGGYTDLQPQHPASRNFGRIFNPPINLSG
jgi:hypothetical protein